MARRTAVLALALVALVCMSGAAEAKAVRQLFLWSLTGGVKAGPAAAAARAALYNAYKTKSATAITNYWVGAQDDELLFSAAKDTTWADLGGYTTWSDADAYKTFKNWEKEQPSYKAIPVTTRTRLIASV